MCLAVPGKIVQITGNEAVVDYGAEKRKGMIIDGEYKKGDYVIIQGGFLVQKVETKEAKAALKLYNESVK